MTDMSDRFTAVPVGAGWAMAAGAAGSSLTAALGLSHLLEIPGRHALDAGQFLALHHHLYGGYAIVGGTGEVMGLAGLLTAGVWLRPADRSASNLLLLSAGLLGTALGVFFVGLAPRNARIAGWTSSTIGSDWKQVRNQWEMLHAVTFALSSSALAFTLASFRRAGQPAAVSTPRAL